ncbi:phenylalanine ammonia-lyase [Aureococcus anophagefferens]|nr:phenylalanine ammonia-lyase [Aureococcus anophagefferens]
MSSLFLLDGASLTTAQLLALAEGPKSPRRQTIGLSDEAWARCKESRAVVDALVESNDVAYGINTGFGLFSNVVVEPAKLSELQENLIRSHSAGVGAPLPPRRTRMLLALRINVLAKGRSGVSIGVLEAYVEAYNADAISVVPSQGTVGASGDLAPLSHLALGLMGEGQCWGPDGASQVDAAELLAARHLKPLALGPKDGLALINGTQMMTALGAEAVCRAKYAALAADVACALTGAVAARLRKLLLPPSALWTSHAYAGRVQDPYTMRCAPQVHGVAHDTIAFVEGLLDVEINSATDNPMIFAGESPDAPAAAPPDPPPPPKAAPTDEVERLRAENEELRARLAGRGAAGTRTKSARDTCYAGGGAVIISGGNFHGAERPREYPAKACDYLAIGVAELANISERRTERLMNPDLSELPAFLTADGGFNSGFMIAHCTAAALASENKVLCHPASADSLSTSAAKEDHVSMGGFAARKALDVVANVEHVVAIEILAACQAIEFHRPLRTTPVLERVHALVRGVAAKWDRDRAMAPDIAAVRDLIRDGALHDAVAADLA